MRSIISPKRSTQYRQTKPQNSIYIFTFPTKPNLYLPFSPLFLDEQSLTHTTSELTTPTRTRFSIFSDHLHWTRKPATPLPKRPLLLVASPIHWFRQQLRWTRAKRKPFFPSPLPLSYFSFVFRCFSSISMISNDSMVTPVVAPWQTDLIPKRHIIVSDQLEFQHNTRVKLNNIEPDLPYNFHSHFRWHFYSYNFILHVFISLLLNGWP